MAREKKKSNNIASKSINTVYISATKSEGKVGSTGTKQNVVPIQVPASELAVQKEKQTVNVGTSQTVHQQGQQTRDPAQDHDEVEEEVGEEDDDGESEESDHGESHSDFELAGYHFGFVYYSSYDFPGGAVHGSIKSRINNNLVEIGKIDAHCIPRGQGRIYEYADSVSRELIQAVTLFMDGDGIVRDEVRHSIGDAFRINAASCNGFLYINDIEVASEHRGQDLGLHLILALFHYLESIDWEWSLVGIMSVPNVFVDTVDRRSHITKLFRHCGRLGFKQVGETLFAYLENRAPISIASKTSTADLVIRFPPPSAQITGDNKLLVNAIGMQDLPTVMNLLARGVSPRDSEALHYAVTGEGGAFTPTSRVICQILLMTDPTLVHSLNCEQQTPLFVAAALKSEEAVRLLIEHGASISVRDRSGHTAQDTMRKQWQNTLDFCRTFGVPPPAREVASYANLQRILTPSTTD